MAGIPLFKQPKTKTVCLSVRIPFNLVWWELKCVWGGGRTTHHVPKAWRFEESCGRERKREMRRRRGGGA